MDASQIVNLIERVFRAMMTPPFIAMILSIVATQAAKVFDHRVWRELKRGEIWVMSYVITQVLCALACLLQGLPYIGPNAAIGLVAGFVGPGVVWALKKYLGVDIDAMFRNGGEPEA